jgi:hypothetical protein
LTRRGSSEAALIAMPCHAMRCHAMPCHAMPCHAHLCPHHLCSLHVTQMGFELNSIHHHGVAQRVVTCCGGLFRWGSEAAASNATPCTSIPITEGHETWPKRTHLRECPSTALLLQLVAKAALCAAAAPCTSTGKVSMACCVDNAAYRCTASHKRNLGSQLQARLQPFLAALDSCHRLGLPQSSEDERASSNWSQAMTHAHLQLLRYDSIWQLQA